MKKLSIIGTVAYDSIKSPHGERERILGGSASFSSIAASLFNESHIVSIVGQDFESKYLDFFNERGINTTGIEIADGNTFHWSGYYEKDMAEAFTLQTDLNVLLAFNPVVPEHCKDSGIVFCANIDPVLQKQAIEQFQNPELVILDTMNFWIEHSKDALLEVLKLVDILIVNDGEARQLTGESNIVNALDALIQLGPKRVIVKKGEHGSIMYDGISHFTCPALPIRNLIDPTGAGDSFAGAFAGYLSSSNSRTEQDFRKAVAFGSIVSAHTVQGFSFDALNKLTLPAVHEQLLAIHNLSSI